MLDFLKSIDTQITLFLNNLHAPILDFLMYHISQLYCAVAFYIFSLIPFFLAYKKKQALRLSLFALLALMLAFLIVNVLIKPSVARIRPCNLPELQNSLHIVYGYVATGYSFVSSHAATSFAFACFICYTLKNKYISAIVLLWAFLYSYSRVYLGVHYVSDIVCGAILGWLCALLFVKLVQYKKPRVL